MASEQPRMGEHSLDVRKPYLDLTAGGSKPVEVRVGCAEIRGIAVGDVLRFVRGDGTQPTRVTAVVPYESSAAVLDTEDPAATGDPAPTEPPTVVRDSYPPEKEALGAFAIHMAPLPG